MNYRDIICISNYEAKLFIRDRGFKIFWALSMGVVLVLHLVSQSKLNHPEWVAISLPSSIPCSNAWLIVYLQTFLVLLWAGRLNFTQRPKETGEAISVRPFSNSSFLVGKIAGGLKVILVCDLLWIGIALGIHLLLSDSPFALYPYFFYFFCQILPALLFSIGLIVCLFVIRSFVLLIPIFLGILWCMTEFVSGHFYRVTDLGAFSLPNLFSEVDGFSNLTFYLLQRLSFCLWGLGLLILGISTVKRLPDHPERNYRILFVGIGVGLCGFLSAGIYVRHFQQEASLRKLYRDTFLKYEKATKLDVIEHHIYFQQHEQSYTASSRLKIRNPHRQTVKEILFYLNPGLEIITAERNGKKKLYKRNQQIISLMDSVAPGDTLEINLMYQGTLIPQVCYPDIPDLQEAQQKRNYYFFNPGHHYFYLQTDFTLLTPECLWYPTTKPPVTLRSPYTTPQEYTDFRLTVGGETVRQVISQGKVQQNGDSIFFFNAYKLPGLSLCMGNYTRKSISRENKLYELWILKGHEYLIESFDDPEQLITAWQTNNCDYPFDKLALIETPIHFCSYPRFWKNRSEYIQPELIFRPEREAWAAISPKLKIPEPAKENVFQTSPQTAYIIAQEMALSNISRKTYTKNLFLEKWGKPQPPLFTQNEYNYTDFKQKYPLFINSTEFKGIDAILKLMQTFGEEAHRERSSDFTSAETIDYLNHHSLQSCLQTNRYDNRIPNILQTKSNYFLRNILCYIPFEEFYKFNQKFFQQYAFEETDYENYCNEFRQIHHIDLYRLTQKLFTTKQLPSFVIGEVELHPLPSNKGENTYIQSVKVWNQGKEDGIITLWGYHLEENRHYLIPAKAAKEICLSFTNSPQETVSLEISTNLSQNIPSAYAYQLVASDQMTTTKIPGVFDLDTLLFLPAKEEYIVDDANAGFRLIEPKQTLKTLFTQQAPLRRQSYDTPKHWSRYYSEKAYGQPVRSYYSRMSGEGNTEIKWETTLRESGEYEVFIYNNDFAFRFGDNYKAWRGEKDLEAAEPIQTYCFHHAEGKETIPLETKEAGSGWVSLGTYLFEAGPVEITLSDRGADSHQVIVADAVKWVKRK